jgi:hypothetical protein
MTEITKEQAISVLIQAAKIGQSKGAYSLEDASVIVQAIKTLAPNAVTEEPAGEMTEEVTESEN